MVDVQPNPNTFIISERCNKQLLTTTCFGLYNGHNQVVFLTCYKVTIQYEQ